MQEATEGPIFLVEAVVICAPLCLVPLLLMLGLSYLLKRLGLIAPPPRRRPIATTATTAITVNASWRRCGAW